MNYSDILEPTSETVSDERIFALIRQWRNVQLSLCDWTQLPDSPVDKTVWATYRQELRDLPAQNPDPKLIVFPVQP
jgi:hypothetical protein